MSRTKIVLAVVQCGTRICVARRSQSVATGQGLWSVVTGYLEVDVEPLAQAWTEVQEELYQGHQPPDLELVRQLEPVPLTSATSGKQFLVYSFLFRCRSIDSMVLNWEHDDMEWVAPSRLASPDCVSWQLPLVNALVEPQTYPTG